MDQQTLKVFELAKELGLTPLSLVDKLNDLNIKVKSHMSDLEPVQVETARNHLGKKVATASAPAKKPAARTRKKSAPAETPTPPPAAEAPRNASGVAPIIRRRTKADGVTETSTTSTSYTSQRDGQPLPEGMEEASAHVEVAQAIEAAEVHEPAPIIEPEMIEEVPEPIEVPAAVVAAPVAPVTPAPVVLHQQPVAPVAPIVVAAAPVAPVTVDPTVVARSTRTPYVPPPRPVAPRRNILRVVDPTPANKPRIVAAAPAPVKAPVAGRTGADAIPGRVFKMNKESLDQMAEEEAAKKRGERLLEIKPEDVRFADYKRKEMVFLPKRKRIPVGKEIKRTQITTAKASKRYVEMAEHIGIQDFANQMGAKAIDVVRKLMTMGQMVSVNSSIDFDTAVLIATEFKHEVRSIAFKEDEFLETAVGDNADNLIERPPVVTIMGHVDHGKTSLLDALRSAKVAEGEAGGITQHIGAYTVEQNGRRITFVDTPGHEAFTSMRARGANVTDIVILVVAADDGVMPQTREALAHAKAAGVPIIVAMNKIDKPQANPEKIKQQLAELDLLAEDWGGQTMFVPVSAVKQTNLDKLLEAILLQSEVLELKANPEARAGGTILEARLEKGRGPMVTLLVKRGTLKVGDSIVAGSNVGRVKALTDHLGQAVKSIGPGTAGEVLGFESLPPAGEKFDSPENDTAARQVAENRDLKVQQAKAASQTRMTLEDLFKNVQAGSVKELNVVLKADVFGSVEAIRDSLVKASNEKVKVKVIHSAPGGVTESDVLLASASNAIIIAFNVRPETKARKLAENDGIEIKTYNIIYEVIEDVKKAMAGLLDKKKVEKFQGRAEVRQTFTVPKVGTVAGCAVIDGKLVRNAQARLLRDSRIIWEGKLASLKRFKDDAKEVAEGYECGLGLDGYNDVKVGDLIESYDIEMITPELSGPTA